MTVSRYPTRFVSVPRAVAVNYWRRPWADVVAAAERGDDGLIIVTKRPRWWGGHPNVAPPVQDVAFLAEGDGNWRGRTTLFQQNW